MPGVCAVMYLRLDDFFQVYLLLRTHTRKQGPPHWLLAQAASPINVGQSALQSNCVGVSFVFFCVFGRPLHSQPFGYFPALLAT